MLRCGCALSIGGGVSVRLGGRDKRSQMQGVWCRGRFQDTQIWPLVLFRALECCAVQDSQGDGVKAQMLAMQRKPRWSSYD